MVLENNPIRKKPLGRPRVRWEDLVKTYIEELDDQIGRREQIIEMAGRDWMFDGMVPMARYPKKKIYY